MALLFVRRFSRRPAVSRLRSAGLNLIAVCFLWAGCSAHAQTTVFGRFGRYHDDGLLTLNVSPTGFQTVEPKPLRVEFVDPGGVASVAAIDSTQKRLRLAEGGPGAPRELRYSLLYPGFSAVFGRRMYLRFLDENGRPTAIRFLADGSITRRDSPGTPLMLAARGGGVIQRRIVSDEGRSELEITSDRDLGEVRFITPLGLMSSDRREALGAKGAQRAHDFWLRTAAPERVSVAYALSPDGRRVTFTETFRKMPGAAFAPVPPVLAAAWMTGYPVRFAQKLRMTDCVTKYGPLAYVSGNVLRYTLPVPPTEERGYLRAPTPVQAAEQADFTRRTALLNDLVGHLGGDWAGNGVDLAYAGMTNAAMAWPYLTPARRAEVQSAWSRYLPAAFRLPPYNDTVQKQPWKQETEPLTGQSYLWTYFIDGPEGRRYDLDWGNALSLYGLYKYAQYSGDWEFVRTRWEDVRRIYQYFDLGDDWAWMSVVNADHGYSTGTGDPMAAAFCGTVASLNMARTLKDRASERHFAMKAARMAVPVAARLALTGWARRNRLIGQTDQVLGFREADSFVTAAPGKTDPWSVTSLLSADGVLPELFAAIVAFDRRGLARYEAEYASAYPLWYRPDATYSFATLYGGNSVYVTFPHFYARSLLGEPSSRLWERLEEAAQNRNNAWIGPNVVAELLSRDNALMLTDWRPASYDSGVLEARRALLEFTLADQPTDWMMTAALRPGISVRGVEVNGKPVRFTVMRNRLTVHLLARGKQRIEVAFGKRRAVRIGSQAATRRDRRPGLLKPLSRSATGRRKR